MACTKTNTQNDTKTLTTLWRNRHLEKLYFCVFRSHDLTIRWNKRWRNPPWQAWPWPSSWLSRTVPGSCAHSVPSGSCQCTTVAENVHVRLDTVKSFKLMGTRFHDLKMMDVFRNQEQLILWIFKLLDH